MRIYGNKQRGIENLRSGREARRKDLAQFNGASIRPPDPNTVLRIIRVEDCMAGMGYQFEIRQGERRNSILVTRFGKEVRFKHGSGLDALLRQIRHDWKLNWLVVG